MTEENIENIRKDAISEIKKKAKKNPEYLHPCNKERKNDENILGFSSGYEYTCWLQQIGVMRHPTDVDIKRNLVTARRQGFESLAEYQYSLAIEKGFSNTTEYKDFIVKKKGFNNIKEYQDSVAKKKGYESHNEYQRKELAKYKADWSRNSRYEKGIQVPMELNEDCASNFGVVIGEELFKIFLERSIFEHVEKTGYMDSGIDFLCKNPRQEFIDKYPQFKLRKDKEYRIQLKMRCLINHNGSIQWIFSIEHNKISDYFILCGWDTREGEPLHIWFIHKDEIIGNRKLLDKESLTITDIPKIVAKFKQYDLASELKVLKEIYENS